MLLKSRSQKAIIQMAEYLSIKFSRQLWVWREARSYHCDFAFTNGGNRQFICRVIGNEIY